MKAFFKTAGIVVLLALLLALLLTGLGRLGSESSPLPHTFQSLLAPVESLLNRAVAELETIYGCLHNYEALQEENAALKAQIAGMEAEVRQSQQANTENERLRELLELRQSHRDYSLLDANLVSWSASNWGSSFTIDRGSADGLAVGHCAITEAGFLIGLVIDTGSHTATIQTLIDPRSAIGARVEPSGGTAVAQGDFSLLAEGRLKLSYVQDASTLCIGDTVLTSGVGGVYPAGLMVGKLTELQADEGGFTQYGVLNPAVSLSTLRQVFLICDYEGAEHES